MYVDFSEINSGDDFENFTKLFLQRLGLRIIVSPAVGSDGGRDLIVEESSQFGQVGLRWLVSCKHFAKTGRAVGNSDDEANINRLREFNCNAFMFFYSTGYTENLRASVERVCEYEKCGFRFFNGYEIGNILISSPIFYPLMQQFLPQTYNNLIGPLNFSEKCCEVNDDSEGSYLFYYKESTTLRVSGKKHLSMLR